MESSTPGLIAQLKGKLTSDRFRCASVYVDHASRNSYVYLQRNTSSNETFLSKGTFEAYSRKLGVDIKHYHCDNGRFRDNLFQRDVIGKGQTMSQCGVSTHFQNSIAEMRIRDLQDYARKSLIHAKIRWPEAITTNLWPYAIRNANDNICMIPDNIDGTSKYERFINFRMSFRLRNKHTLFCPEIALQNTLQQARKIEKWSPRARLGINLGPLP